MAINSITFWKTIFFFSEDEETSINIFNVNNENKNFYEFLAEK